MINPENNTIILAGITGALRRKIAYHLRKNGVTVIGIVRTGCRSPEIPTLREQGIMITEVDFNDIADLVNACKGGSCVVSAVAGLRDVIVGLQTNLVRAAVEAGVPRFFPSDYSTDFTRLSYGTNRNLDLRREFHEYLSREPIAVTSVLNGMFMNLLTGQAPIILFKIRRVLCYGDADQPLDFTAMDDVANYTAQAALDPATPRFLRVAGEVTSIRGLQKTATEVCHKKFRLLRPGGLGMLEKLIRLTRALTPESDALYPPWQGMQYLHNMLSGKAKLEPLDNDRYPDIRWTSIYEMLSERER